MIITETKRNEQVRKNFEKLLTKLEKKTRCESIEIAIRYELLKRIDRHAYDRFRRGVDLTNENLMIIENYINEKRFI
jgi:hypothetical protein